MRESKRTCDLIDLNQHYSFVISELVKKDIIQVHWGSNSQCRVFIYDLIVEKPTITVDELRTSVATFIKLNNLQIGGLHFTIPMRDTIKPPHYVPNI